MVLKLDTPIQYAKGVGPKRAEAFAKVGIETVSDLLAWLPFRYEDRTNFRSVAELRAGEPVVLKGEVLLGGRYTTPVKRVSIYDLRVRDASGIVTAKFFNQDYLERVFRRGQQVILYGTPKWDEFNGENVLVNPEWELLDGGSDDHIHVGRIVPVYRKIGPVYGKTIRHLIWNALNVLPPESFEESLPGSLVGRLNLLSRRDALRGLHFPECPPGETRRDFLKKLEESASGSHQRLIFEELFTFQLGLQIVKANRAMVPKGRKLQVNPAVRELLKSVLPFRPTGAQKRVLKDIVEDLCRPYPMNRLLQGDVGSGKTIVALQAMLVVVENGYQAVLMAPTEILAEQHFQTLQGYLEKTPYQAALLTGSVKGKARKSASEAIRSGSVQVVVGTHAVFQKGVDFKDLGLVVIDEQHRFGVLQRSKLMEKGQRPDTLVMTATPIPRSLALTLYGDLELSIIDELPPGRQPVKTLLVTERRRKEVYSAVERELARGRQAYVVYPLIEESEKMDLRAATEMAAQLQESVFRPYRVGLLHGRVGTDEKEALMAAFKAGQVHVLVATTVVEVGIDVPNATVMVVEHAERFGLSQLHQLRGRIGRGSRQSYCVLLTEGTVSSEAFQRLRIMRESSDGFRIAEKDLEIRGPGEFVGTRQSGMPGFLFANILRDRRWLELARSESERYLRELLSAKDSQAVLERLGVQWKKKFGLYEVA